MLKRIYLGIGSSENREENIRSGVSDLVEAFPGSLVSPVYETEAIGFVGDPFYNLVVGFDSDIGLRQLFVMTRAIEEAHGRQRFSAKCSGKMLDIDILIYGDLVGVHEDIELPRDEIVSRAFVLCPLADIAPDELHPVLQRSYSELWQGFNATQAINQIAFEW